MSTESYGMSAEEAKAKSTAWAVTYADLVTLLLTFFILLLVILNDAEKHIDRVINMLLDETYTELKENIDLEAEFSFEILPDFKLNAATSAVTFGLLS